MIPEEKYKGIYNPKSNRLQKYDYMANSGYFITICTKDREHYFGKIVNGEMMLNEVGKIVFEELQNINNENDDIKIDEFVVMPNHLHFILFINNHSVETSIYGVSKNNMINQDAINSDIINQDAINRVSTGMKGGITGNKNVMLQKQSVGFIVRKLKGKTKFLINQSYKNTINPVLQYFSWQPNYYDRIIRNEDELQKIRQYIFNNPLKWELDKNNTENIFM